MSALKTFSLFVAGLLLAAVTPAEADPIIPTGNVIVGGLEDHPGGTVYEGYGDYNDLMFELQGNITVVAPSADPQAFDGSVLNESGSIFWDNHSYDGTDTNFGYCVIGSPGCSLSSQPPGPLDYLATPGGGMPLTELFQADGLVTVTILGKKTSNASNNTLGWYDPSNPTVLHQIFAGADPTGTVFTFAFSGTFALYSSNGVGQVYSSLASDNQGESTSFQHFALLAEPIPEPSTMFLAGCTLAAALAAKKIYTMLSTRWG